MSGHGDLGPASTAALDGASRMEVDDDNNDNDNDGGDNILSGRAHTTTPSLPASQHDSHNDAHGATFAAGGVPATPPPPTEQHRHEVGRPPSTPASASSQEHPNQRQPRRNHNNARGRPKTPPRTPTTQTPPAKRQQQQQHQQQQLHHSSSHEGKGEEDDSLAAVANVKPVHAALPPARPADMTVLICRVDFFDAGGAVSVVAAPAEEHCQAMEVDHDNAEGGESAPASQRARHEHGNDSMTDDDYDVPLASTPPPQNHLTAAAVSAAMHHKRQHSGYTPPHTPPPPSGSTSKPPPQPRSPLPSDIPRIRIGPYQFYNDKNNAGHDAGATVTTTTPAPGSGSNEPATGAGTVVVVRVPHFPAHPPPPNSSSMSSNSCHSDDDQHHHNHSLSAPSTSSAASFWMHVAVLDKHSQPLPSHMDPKLSKYWYQRRRLFHKFDDGIQLDDEGWFSVSPEQVADHVSHTVGNVLRASHLQIPSQPPQLQPQQLVMLDAFCGCGGNSISFAKCLAMGPNPCLSLVVAVDMDRAKLRRAAHNAGIYGIPTNRIVFVEANVLFLLEHAYRNGEFVLDQPITSPEAADALMRAMPPPVETEIVAGYCIGGIDLLPRTVSLVHLDPPWGGVEYQVLGKNGYDLHRNMKIQRPSVTNRAASAAAAASAATACADAGSGHDDGELHSDFFDSFCSAQPPASSNHSSSSSARLSKQQRKAQFNAGWDDDDCVSGEELLALAAAATRTHIVSFDVPRNINRNRLGQAALKAGYRGNCRLEEQYLNGRLKTVTAYFGSDWSASLTDLHLLAAALVQPPPQGPSQPSLDP